MDTNLDILASSGGIPGADISGLHAAFVGGTYLEPDFDISVFDNVATKIKLVKQIKDSCSNISAPLEIIYAADELTGTYDISCTDESVNNQITALQNQVAALEPVEITVAGSATYEVPANSGVSWISVLGTQAGVAKCGASAGDNYFFEMHVNDGQAKRADILITTNADTYTLHFTGNFVAKIYI